jgi:hypothetical protein
MFLGGCILLLPIENNWLWTLLLFYNYSWCNIVGPDLDQITITDQEGRALRGTKKSGCIIGFFGALWVAYWFMYAWLISLFGGHRSWASHGFEIGTIIRMAYYNFGIVATVFEFENFIKYLWQSPIITFNLHLNIWLIPYLVTQFVSWSVADGIHLILDIKSVEKILGTYGKNNRR